VLDAGKAGGPAVAAPAAKAEAWVGAATSKARPPGEDAAPVGGVAQRGAALESEGADWPELAEAREARRTAEIKAMRLQLHQAEEAEAAEDGGSAARSRRRPRPNAVRLGSGMRAVTRRARVATEARPPKERRRASNGRSTPLSSRASYTVGRSCSTTLGWAF
jgi:hypothetical protein